MYKCQRCDKVWTYRNKGGRPVNVNASKAQTSKLEEHFSANHLGGHCSDYVQFEAATRLSVVLVRPVAKR